MQLRKIGGIVDEGIYFKIDVHQSSTMMMHILNSLYITSIEELKSGSR